MEGPQMGPKSDLCFVLGDGPQHARFKVWIHFWILAVLVLFRALDPQKLDLDPLGDRGIASLSPPKLYIRRRS